MVPEADLEYDLIIAVERSEIACILVDWMLARILAWIPSVFRPRCPSVPPHHIFSATCFSLLIFIYESARSKFMIQVQLQVTVNRKCFIY